MFTRLRKTNLFSFVAAGLLFASVIFPWWGLDISGPSYGISYSFRWTVWAGPITSLAPPQPYSEVNNLSQVLTSGTSIIGTLALDAAVLLLLGISPKRSKFLTTGLAVAGLASIGYLGITVVAVDAAHSAWPVGCISGSIGSCLDGAPPTAFAIVWGFQPGFYLLIAGAIMAFFAVIFDVDILRTSSESGKQMQKFAQFVSPAQL
jgi:hypothetical protein